EEDAERRGAGAKGSRNARCQSVTRGCTDHQYLFRAVGDVALPTNEIDLLPDVGFTADRMSGDAHKAAYTRFDYHAVSLIEGRRPGRKGGIINPIAPLATSTVDTC